MTTPDERNLNLTPKRILVFPCGSEIGLEIHRSLSWNKHFQLIGASSSTSNHGPYFFKNYIEGLPFYNDPDFIQGVNNLVVSERIDLIFPANDDVQLKLAQNAQHLKCALISSSQETCEICRSKSATYRFFEDALKVPHIYALNNIDAFPVFLKPDNGQGSEGVHLAMNRDEVRFYLAQSPDLLILENLPGKEYTVDCFTDRHGVLRGAYPRLRARINRGISVETFPVHNPAFTNMAGIINEKLDLRGGWFFQAKEDKNGFLSLMEVASRIAGSMGLTRNLGVNIPLLSVYDRLDMEVQIHLSRHDHNIIMDRALDNRFKTNLDYQHVYVDLDDTLIVDGQVNTLLVAFLFQCKNKAIQNHVITRNSADIHQLLREYGLESLFTDIIRVEPHQDKAEKMIHTNAIFIDDSFQERAHVAERLAIPTFDLDAVESLIDFRR